MKIDWDELPKIQKYDRYGRDCQEFFIPELKIGSHIAWCGMFSAAHELGTSGHHLGRVVELVPKQTLWDYLKVRVFDLGEGEETGPLYASMCYLLPTLSAKYIEDYHKQYCVWAENHTVRWYRNVTQRLSEVQKAEVKKYFDKYPDLKEKYKDLI